MARATSFPAIARALRSSLGVEVDPQPDRAVHGGCINDCYRWTSARGPLFVKVAGTAGLAMFEAEAAGLRELQRAAAVRVPDVLAVGTAQDDAFLALEWIDLTAPGETAQAALGEQLARLHEVHSTEFGWHRDNTIGSTLQPNAWSGSWIDFVRTRRLGHQLDLARRNGFRGRLQQRGTRLLDRLDALFGEHRPEPALLHGDLWGGNWGADPSGRPVIFDPAVYYGDCEADIAMTRLFGGFGPAFHATYERIRPPADGARERADLYDLYHLLNHLNLFGAGYLPQVEATLERLLARC